MPSNRMSTFLRWSRSYREQFGDERYRRTWRAISDRYPHAGTRISVISFCSDCDKAIITGGDTFANNITRQFGVACVNCAICPQCCQCDWCNAGSHYTTAEFCTNCSNQNCAECCNCEGRVSSRAPINFFRNKPFFWDANRAQRKVNPTNRYIAAEIEVAEITKDSQYLEEKIRKWRGSVVEDGSLPTTGFEINTAPAAGDKYAQQIEDICEGLRRAGGSINTKCGLHVHMDARDFDYYDLRRLARVYAAIEPALFKMVPESRRNSRFAKKCGMEYLDAMRWGKYPYSQVKADIVKSLYRIEQIDRENGRGLKKMKKSKYQDARYSALNLHSFFFRGTVECRLFNGTLNADKIINWGVMWAMIMDYVAKHDDDTVDRELPLSDVSALDNLLKMLTNDAVRSFAKQRYEQYAKEVETGEKRKRTRPAPVPPAPRPLRFGEVRLRSSEFLPLDSPEGSPACEWTDAAPVGTVMPAPVDDEPLVNFDEYATGTAMSVEDLRRELVETQPMMTGTPLTRENLEQAAEIARNQYLADDGSEWRRFTETYRNVDPAIAPAPAAPGPAPNTSALIRNLQQLTEALERGGYDTAPTELRQVTPQLVETVDTLVGLIEREGSDENND